MIQATCYTTGPPLYDMQIEHLLKPALEITATESKRGWGGGGGSGKVTFIISIKYNANGL
jgi:hypothetical protein